MTLLRTTGTVAAIAATVLAINAYGPAAKDSRQSNGGLVGYWKLNGDANDHSGRGNHGRNHGVDLATGSFDGRGSYIEVPDSPSLRFGAGDFSIAAWVHTEQDLEDVIGDVAGKFDPALRKGFTLNLNSSAAGYNSSGNDQHVLFGIDNGDTGTWQDCGRPGGVTHNSDALTAFDGSLYVGVCDAPKEEDWAHVFRYRGGKEWEDLGRLGRGKTHGVYAMVVHNGALYAATSASHGARPPSMDFGRVYRYRGANQWEDLGQPGSNHRLNSMASYKGKLYVCGFNIGKPPGHCYVYQGAQEWAVSGTFDGMPHTMAVHDGKLYAAYPKGEVFAFDGNSWTGLGNPYGSTKLCSQIHSMGVHRGELYVGTWPLGKVAVLRGGKWQDSGHPGDSTEVIGLATYNGSLYAGTIPRAEVFRFGGGTDWMSIGRLFAPPGFHPVPVGSTDAAGVADWSRATSISAFEGRLFASTGTCYRRMVDPPRPGETRGKVYSLSAGASVMLHRDIGPGWKHLVAAREGRTLKLYVNGRMVASTPLASSAYDVSNNEPLLIGFGPVDYFSGKIREVRLYNQAIGAEQVRQLATRHSYQ
jgi:hypothetical protein